MQNDIAAKIKAVLEPLVGEVLAEVSLELEAKRIGRSPGTLTSDDLPQFAANLETQLRLVVGPVVARRAANRVAEID